MGYLVHFDWGPTGASHAAERNDLIVIVDTLSFSTCVATATERGVLIFPCGDSDRARLIADRVGAEIAVRRKEVPHKGRFSLSPLTYLDVESGTRVALPSPNGAACCQLSQSSPFVFTGAMVNAQVLGEAVNNVIGSRKVGATVVACGERVMTDIKDSIRWAIEDYLGAGAVISYLRHEKSIEAQLCEMIFIRNQDRLNSILLQSESGRELCEVGFSKDVTYAAQLNVCRAAPLLCDDHFECRGQK